MKIPYKPKRFAAKSQLLIEQCNSFIGQYQADGYKLTLRQLYYRLVGADLIPNNQESYDRVGSIVNDARLAGHIDWNAIEDRTRNLNSLSHWRNPGSIVQSAANSYRTDKWKNQDYRVEVWVEKEALAAIVERSAESFDVDWMACRGYMSQSEMHEASQRFLRYMDKGQQVVIVHLGDHDPSGIDMTRDIGARLQDFIEFHHANSDLEVERIALNMEQIEQYNPPPNPAKKSDSRFDGYRDAYGTKSWELDALEPTVLSGLISDAVLGYRDEDKWQDALDAEEAEKVLLESVADNWNMLQVLLEGDFKPEEFLKFHQEVQKSL